MKKFIITTLLGLSSFSAIAAPVGSVFSSLGVGLDLTSTKYQGFKRSTGVGVVIDYGFDYGANLVGFIEAKIKFNNPKLQDINNQSLSTSINEKWRTSMSYLQGYSIIPDALPYVKAGYSVAKIDKKLNSRALVFGLGIKYAVSSNFEVGAEYLRSRARFKGKAHNANTLGANATYRF